MNEELEVNGNGEIGIPPEGTGNAPQELEINGDEETNAQREETFGEDAVGLDFNLSQNTNVYKIKKLYAEIIDLLNGERLCGGLDKHPEKNRYLSVAITETQTAQMWAVRAITK